VIRSASATEVPPNFMTTVSAAAAGTSGMGRRRIAFGACRAPPLAPPFSPSSPS
jgi:hypothetical protein